MHECIARQWVTFRARRPENGSKFVISTNTRNHRHTHNVRASAGVCVAVDVCSPQLCVSTENVCALSPYGFCAFNCCTWLSRTINRTVIRCVFRSTARQAYDLRSKVTTGGGASRSRPLAKHKHSSGWDQQITLHCRPKSRRKPHLRGRPLCNRVTHTHVNV